MYQPSLTEFRKKSDLIFTRKAKSELLLLKSETESCKLTALSRRKLTSLVKLNTVDV